ncbi:ATP-binding cassette domain-containing protein [uncultured Desulfobacter sp.]|uniref:ABC transporter ATP-binding protein n=1 Tax=uncultured Desulfobacter sp. TaxID=240139 RepID=UPI002AAA9313|nr:ATP-binding cassette domain-containing protein [uncultured Desulfobacter sp.]
MNGIDCNNSPLVEMKGVTKAYYPGRSFFSKGKKTVLALDHVDLFINRGEILGLVGQSGSGKTTCGRLLVRLETPTKGHISLDGQHVGGLCGRELKQFRARVQMIFQDPYQSLNPHLSIAETIMEPLIVHRIGTHDSRRTKVLAALETVGLQPGRDYYSRYPHQLSGGQRQRVAIARAIVLKPQFVVADEPTSMLDATIAIQLFEILKQIRNKFHMTFLLITHNLAAARYLCDRVAVIHEGRIVEVNTAKKIIEQPQHPYTKKLIDVQPRLTGINRSFSG